MIWHSVGEFLAMGGYGGYVWGSVGVTAAMMFFEVASLAARRREALRALARDARRGERA